MNQRNKDNLIQNIFFTVGISIAILCGLLIVYHKQELNPQKWILSKYQDEAGIHHLVTTCPRCRSVWEFSLNTGKINYCPTCGLRLEGVRSEK